MCSSHVLHRLWAVFLLMPLSIRDWYTASGGAYNDAIAC